MSNIIIEGKNLNDINQSNFQTVGVRSGFHFITNPNATLSVDESVFKYDTLEIHEARLGDDYENISFPKQLLKSVTIEPWQGRLHYDISFTGSLDGLSTDAVPQFTPISLDNLNLTPYMSDGSISYLYPYLFTGNLFNNNTRYKINSFYDRINNNNALGLEEKESNVFIVKDDRFSLGTYTEENKQYWELQTSDPISRNSQFSSQRMQTAQSTKLENTGLIRSEEEQFSVDAFTFTERDGVITPLFFYYDKKLHPTEYNNATTGKVNMRIELRESGRNGEGEIDLYQERRPVRPFLMGFEKDEQVGAGINPLNDEQLIGTGDVYGDGLYYFDTRIQLSAIAESNSYLLGIFKIPEDSLVSTGGAEGKYTFMMPNEDVQYLAKFRPNPYIIMRQRFTDQFGNETVGGPESKGEIRLWQSKLYYDNDESEYYTVPINDVPSFKTGGARFFEDTFRPFDFGGEPITIEQREITDNYKFKGFTYLSGSINPQEVPFPSEPIQIQTTGPAGATVTAFADQVYEGISYGNPGNDETSIKTIKLVQDFFYPAGRLNIYANYGLITFTIHNFNNTVDFENNFAEALKYGPFKFATALGGQLGGAPNPDNYRFDDLTSFPAFSPNAPTVRLLISGPEMGYVNTVTTPSIEIEPTGAPDGWSMMNPMVGTLSPQGQWVWNGGAWVENPDYDPSGQSIDYLPTGDNAHLVPIEETGFDFGKFIWLKQGNPNFPDGEPIEIYKDSSDDIPNTLQSAIDIAGEFPPTYNSNGFNDSVTGTQFSAGYSVGDTAGPGGIFIVTSVEEDQSGSDPYEGYYVWNVEWGPNFTSANTPDLGNFYDLSNNENDFQGINLRGDVGDDEFLVGTNIINQIISTETTSSISYQPLQRGTYVKAFNDGFIETLVEKSEINSMIPIRPANLSGAIDADMYGFGHQVQYNITPTMASMPPQIAAYVARANGALTLSTNIHPTLDLERLGVSIGDWNENGGGNFTYTIPESREATYMAGDDEISLYWKYIEFRIVVSETAEGEQSESGEAIDPEFYVGLNIFSMPGAGGQIFDDETDELVSTGGLINLFNIQETVDENGIPYQEFSQVPSGQRNITLRAVPSAGQFAVGEEGTWSFMADPGVNVDTVGSIQEFLNADGHHVAIITFNEEGPVTVRYSWFGDDDGGGF